LKKLQDAQAEAARVESFNQRMTSLDDEFDISDEARKVIASQVQKLDSDEDFNSWKESMSVFLKVKEDESKKEEEAKASESKQEEASASEKAVDDALDNGEKEKSSIPNSAKASTADKWADAMKEEDCIIK
jgi:hypothetical protein